MSSNNKLINTVYESISLGINQKVLHLTNQPEYYADGRIVRVNKKNLINFSSYSYLGLEVDPRIKEAGIQTIRKYGTQFGASRAFISIDLYEEFESLLSNIFNAHAIVAPSTTLAHQAALPVIIGDNDCIILDQHVHASIKTTCDMLKARSIPVEIVRHNRIDLLEKRILKLKNKYDTVWYMADGVYSMHGDFAPLQKIEALMIKHSNFRVYIDDAHGMSWTGQNGKGYVLNKIDLHKQMILVTSLNKAFAGAGGVIVVNSEDEYKLIKRCGGTLIFSTPIQPPMLGINIASAKIHFSGEINSLQQYFKIRIAYCHQQLKASKLPDISDQDSPIFYIATGTPKVSFNLVKRMMTEGYYMSSALFPAVGLRQSGIRFCVNINHSLNDIDQMINRLSYHFSLAFYEEEVDIHKLPLYFPNLVSEQIYQPSKNFFQKTTNTSNIEVYQSIDQVDQVEWDRLFLGKGSFDWNGLKFLENSFKNNLEKENNWEFWYFIIRDENNVPIIATFFTLSWAKNDMFSKSVISKSIEKQRNNDRYFMSNQVLTMGSMLTEGEHLYINTESSEWEKELRTLISCVTELQEERKVNQIVFRDFEENELIKELLISEGFARIELPNSNILGQTMIEWKSVDAYLEKLKPNARNKIKKNCIKKEHFYSTSFPTKASSTEIDHWYTLYLQVHSKALEINTFPISKKVFRNAINNEYWDVMKLDIKAEHLDSDVDQTVAIGLIYKSGKTYSPMVLGLDYRYIYSFGNYRQAIYQLIKRANSLGMEQINMGFTADIEKQNFGAESIKKKAFVLVNDSFDMEVVKNR